MCIWTSVTGKKPDGKVQVESHDLNPKVRGLARLPYGEKLAKLVIFLTLLWKYFDEKTRTHVVLRTTHIPKFQRFHLWINLGSAQNDFKHC